MSVTNTSPANKMDKQIVLCLIAVCVLGVTSKLTLKNLHVPDVIRNGSKTELFLDCEYQVDQEHAAGLVVKWFYDDTKQVYQWIPGHTPQDIGLLKGKLDLKYKASNVSLEEHRAMHIIEVSPQLTGKYTCLVDTFAGEVRDSKKMVIYDVQDFQMRYEPADHDTVRVTCSAEDVYPRPNITIYDRDGPVLGETENISRDADNLYDISTSALIDVDGPETFTCELSIPEANYSVRKELYYSSQEVTEITSSSSEMSLQLAEDYAVRSGGISIQEFSSWSLLVALLFVINIH